MTESTTVASKMSTAQLRKIKKPMIEKRRRGRINESLNQLKSLVLEALHKDESRYSKMEKADILEMTVKHLKAVHKQQVATTTSIAMTTGQDPYGKYRAGFNECAQEIGNYLNQVPGVGPDVQGRLRQHLDKVGQPRTTVMPPSATPLTSLPGGATSPFVIGQLGMTQMTQMTQPLSVTVMTPPVAPSSESQNLNLNSAIPLYISPRAGSSPGTISPAMSSSSLSSSSRSNTPCSSVNSPQAGDEVPHRFREMSSPMQTVFQCSPELTRASPIIVQPSLEVKAGPVWRPW